MKNILRSLLVLLVLTPAVAFAFTDNTSTPTANNAAPPINTSNQLQVKEGAFATDSYLQADIFYDRYNSGYYMQPRGTNRLNYIVANNTYTTGNSITDGEVQGSSFRDRNNGGFYLDPNGVSIVEDIRAAVFYDRINTGYYVQPRGTNRLNYVVADNVYAYGTGNFADVYIRNAGRWASQVGQIYIQRYGAVGEPAYLYCQPGDVAIAMGATHSDQDNMFSTWRHTGDRGIAACEDACNGETFTAMWLSCQDR